MTALAVQLGKNVEVQYPWSWQDLPVDSSPINQYPGELMSVPLALGDLVHLFGGVRPSTKSPWVTRLESSFTVVKFSSVPAWDSTRGGAL